MNYESTLCLIPRSFKAFTLTEVITVIGLLAVVAAITLPMILNAGVQEANEAKHKQAEGFLAHAFSEMSSEGIATPNMADFITYLEKGRPLPTAGRDFDCPLTVPDDFTWLNCTSNRGVATPSTSPLGVRLKNGALLVYQNTATTFDLSTANQVFRVLIDSSGSFDDNPDTARLYYINSSGLVSNP